MQRNQWPLRYSAAAVREAALRQEAHYRAEAEEHRYQAMLGEDVCGECGRDKGGDKSYGRSNPKSQATAADKKADEYAKWAKALETRGQDTLALHFDDAEYFGLLIEEAELGKTQDPHRPAVVARQTQRLRPSGLSVSEEAS